MSKTSSYGTGCKPFSYSLFIDYEGADTYICPEPKGTITFNNWDSFGGVWPESEPDLWPYAICLDLGGRDDYRVRNRANNSERHSFGHGIHLDLEWTGPDVIGTPGDLAPAYEAYAEFDLPDQVEASPYHGDIRLLQDKNLFVRFQAMGRLIGADPGVIPVLAAAIKGSSHQQFNRDVMECIHYFLVEDKVTEREAPALVSLLDAVDPEVRTIIAADFGIWKIAEAESGLIEAVRGDEVPSVRRFAVRSLSDLDAVKYAPMIRAFAVSDTSPEVRKACVEFLAAMPDTNGLAVFVSILDGEPRPSLRVAAAEAIGEIRRREGAEALLRATNVPDVYLMRAVGKALAELHEMRGIEMLIESLEFPSIDAFYNYDNNIPNAIAAYAGHDLPDADRYDRQKWQQWFRDNRGKIDLEQNVEAYRRFRALADSVRDATDEESILRFEGFLADYPASISAKKALSRTLNRVAWDMVTTPEGSDAYDPVKGLRYAKRAVELNPEMNYVDTLAEAYLANDRIDEAAELCRRMLEEHPGERMFIDRLRRCEQLKR
jgi:HEAT repeat protein